MQPRSLAFAALPLLLTGSLVGQTNWVNWVDETSTRIDLPPFMSFRDQLGQPFGPPYMASVTDDDAEKDMIQGDFDKDGFEDVIIVRKKDFSNPGPRTNILLMNEFDSGSGLRLLRERTDLAPGLEALSDARDVAIFDYNLDGYIDFVVANTFDEDPQLWENLGDDGAGNWLGFQERTNWITTTWPIPPMFCAVYEGDVNGDGWEDLYFSDYDNDLEDRLLINSGPPNFTFADETDTRFNPGFNNSVFGTGSFVCDFTGDGVNDILKVSGMFDPMDLLINSGPPNYVFDRRDQISNFGDAVYMARVDDFDKDGRLDVFVIDDGQDFILYNTGTTFSGGRADGITTTRRTVTQSQRTSGFGGNVKARDLDRDGYIDLGVCDVDVDISNCNSGQRFAALRNMGGEFGPAMRGFREPDNDTSNPQPWNTAGTHDIVFIDIDGDGFQDMLTATCSRYFVFMMDPAFAYAEEYGEGCPGTGGLTPKMAANGRPALPNPGFTMTLEDAAPNAQTLLLVGLGRETTPTAGLLGCDLLVDIGTFFTVDAPTTDMFGGAMLPLPTPNDPSQEGVKINFQWLTVDLAGPFLGFTTVTNGLEIFLSTNTF